MSKSKVVFDTVEAASRLVNAMETAINNMIEEVKKPVDQELNGTARKAELSAIKQTAIDCKELIKERDSLITMVNEYNKNGQISEKTDYSAGFAEKFSK
jgi:hypothetical protein